MAGAALAGGGASAGWPAGRRRRRQRVHEVRLARAEASKARPVAAEAAVVRGSAVEVPVRCDEAARRGGSGRLLASALRSPNRGPSFRSAPERHGRRSSEHAAAKLFLSFPPPCRRSSGRTGSGPRTAGSGVSPGGDGKEAQCPTRSAEEAADVATCEEDGVHGQTKRWRDRREPWFTAKRLHVPLTPMVGSPWSRSCWVAGRQAPQQ
ncbi:hypothetical protein OsI_07404 [Oryza sativa Indica Group]|uniref:Uncharacterized protein n=1 Tax=Oryza sativa subsp. indica TaxID=39946 RepID=B8AIM7_ORYSI|nr:hypothetical protein OsI_07404 [Oryza sativa Indica Group]